MADIDDEDFPLSDHPGPGGPKAGDREMNRARDIMHLDVAGARAMPAFDQKAVAESEQSHALNPSPSSSPVVAAWQAFKQTSGYTSAINSADPGWSMFMAGYAARDSRP